MGRHPLPHNAVCVTCGDSYRRRPSTPLTRCPECRVGMQGKHDGPNKVTRVCPMCGGAKAFSSKVCMDCRNAMRKAGV